MNIIPMINCSTKSNRTPPSLPLPLTLSRTSPTHPLSHPHPPTLSVVGSSAAHTQNVHYSLTLPLSLSLSLSLTHPPSHPLSLPFV